MMQAYALGSRNQKILTCIIKLLESRRNLEIFIVIIHPIHAEGDPFKLLGCMVDCKLVMNHAVDKVLTQVRPKIRAILRTKKYYCSSDLINQFKIHIWSLMEIHNGAIFHASSTLLSKLDAIQRSFLKEINIF